MNPSRLILLEKRGFAKQSKVLLFDAHAPQCLGNLRVSQVEAQRARALEKVGRN